MIGEPPAVPPQPSPNEPPMAAEMSIPVAPAPLEPTSVPIPAPFDINGYRGLPLSAFTWRFSMIVAVMVASVLPIVVIRVLVVREIFDPSASDMGRFAVSLVPYAFGVVTAWLVVRLKGGRLSEAVGLRPFVVLTGAVAAGGGAVISRILTIQVSSWLVLLGMDPTGTDQFSLWGDSTLGLVTMAIIAVVIAPFAEELLFRGVLLTWLHDRWGAAVGVLVSSALFGAVHVDWFLLLPLTLVGMIQARIYLSTRSLWIAIVSHSLFNLSGVVLYLLLRAVGTV